MLYANNKQRRAGVATLVLDEIDFQSKSVTKDKEVHYIMIKKALL